MINTTGNNFSNSQPVNHGELIFLNRQAFKVGADLSHQFNKIKLPNGSPLKVSPDDYILQFRLIRGGQEGKTIDHIELPSSLFTQARKGDKIFFTQYNKNFELTLSPTLSGRNPVLTFSFDSCLKGTIGQGCTRMSMYMDKRDIPQKDLFVSEENTLLHWGDYVELSPKAQRLVIGKRGCLPSDLDELTSNLKIVDKDVPKFIVRDKKLEDRILLFIDMPGLCMDNQNFVDIDLIVDSNRLYVHGYQKSTDRLSDQAKEKMLFLCEGEDIEDIQLVSEKFYWINFEGGQHQIDKDAILATPIMEGILQVELPYKTKDSMIVTEQEDLILQPTQKHEWIIPGTIDTSPSETTKKLIEEEKNEFKIEPIILEEGKDEFQIVPKEADFIDTVTDQNNQIEQKPQIEPTIEENPTETLQSSLEDYHIEEINEEIISNKEETKNEQTSSRCIIS